MIFNIFQYLEYKQILKEQIRRNEGVRGYQARLAEAAGCQPSFLSQILNSSIQMTPDQAAGIAELWNLSEDETEYFMSLVSIARTTHRSYKNQLALKIKNLKTKHQNISERVKLPTLTSHEQQTLYYSAWYWVAIHIISGIPEFQKAAQTAERLKLPLRVVERSLNELEKMGLLTQKAGKWTRTQKAIHIPKDSPMINMHLLNWRGQAMENVYTRDADDLHYSAVHSLSREDYEKLKDLLLQFVDNSKTIISPSIDEELICINLDCFKI